MGNREKPRLHEVRGNSDPELHCEDLWWYFGCYDFEAMKRCAGFEHAAFYTGNFTRAVFSEETGDLPKVKKTMIVDERKKNPYTDWHVNFGSSGVFTRGRRIWNRLSRLSWSEQEDLRIYYEPRQYFPPEFKPIPDARIRALHRSYYGAGA